ncbi:MAG: cyclic nucleotide-binding domain-containing protein [Acidimicrobiales bacterium]
MEPRYDFGPEATIRTLAPGEILCEEGGTDTDVFLVLSGQLEVERSSAEGPMIVATLGPGRLVGEVTSAVGGARSATLRAREATEVAVLDQAGFGEWLDADPQRAAGVAAAARHRLNRTRAASVLVALFGLDNQDVIDAIVDEIRWMTLAPGDVLFDQHDESDAAYLVIAGRLHLLAHDTTGAVTLDIEIGRGEIVGEMGIIDDAPRSAGARAIRETTLAMISRESFESLTTAHPMLLLRVFRSIVDRLMHRHQPDHRARVVGVAVTAPDQPPDLLAPLVAAIQPFGSTLHLSTTNLGRFVRKVDAPGGDARVAEFLHESDVAHDYLVLEGERELTPWSIKVAKQSDRYVLFTSARPGSEERALIRAHLGQLTPTQLATTWIARLHPAPGRTSGGAALLDEFGVAEIHNIRAGDAGDLARLGRLATGNGTGLVLGGGGAKGLAHIGAIRALREAGVEIDKVGGASMGSVIAALYAQGHSPEEMLAITIEQLRSDVLDYTLPLVSLIRAEKLTATVARQFGDWDICDLWLPYYAVTTNLTAAELTIHRRGCLKTAIRASAAIPVVMAPVPIDGELHVDGGVLDNVPVTAMADDPSIGTVIAVDVSPPGGPRAESDYGLSVSGFDVLRRRLSRNATSLHPDIGQTLMNSMLIGSSKAKTASIERVDLYLDLDLGGVGLLKFENHRDVALRGYGEAKPAVEAWVAARSERAVGPDDRRDATIEAIVARMG